MTTAIPAIEIAYHGNATGVRCPDRKVDAADSIDNHWMGAKLVKDIIVIAFTKKVSVKIRHNGKKTVGIMKFDYGSSLEVCSESVGKDFRTIKKDSFAETAFMYHCHGMAIPVSEINYFKFAGIRSKGPDGHTLMTLNINFMGSQNTEWISVVGVYNLNHIIDAGCGPHRHPRFSNFKL
jgi:hypothetical protein